MPQTMFIETNGRSAQELVEDKDVNAVLDCMKYPIIVKSRISTYFHNTHNMVIVNDKETFFKLL